MEFLHEIGRLLTTDEITCGYRALTVLYPHILPHFYMIRSVELRLLSNYIVRTEGPFLDLGCGDGCFGKSLGLKDVYGIDIDEKLIKSIQKDDHYVGVYHADASKIPFKNDSFSTVFSNCALEHMDQIKKVLIEIKRVLKDQGKFILTVPTERLYEVIRKDAVLRKAGLGGQHAWDRYNRIHHHVNMFELGTWKELLEPIGFRILNHQYYLPGFIGRFVARMDMLYTVATPKTKNLVDKLENRYWSLAGLPLRIYFCHYIRNLRSENSGTHLIIRSEKV